MRPWRILQDGLHKIFVAVMPGMLGVIQSRRQNLVRRQDENRTKGLAFTALSMARQTISNVDLLAPQCGILVGWFAGFSERRTTGANSTSNKTNNEKRPGRIICSFVSICRRCLVASVILYPIESSCTRFLAAETWASNPVRYSGWMYDSGHSFIPGCNDSRSRALADCPRNPTRQTQRK